MPDLITTILAAVPQTATVISIYKAAKPALSTVLKPALEEVGEMGRDYIKSFRANNGAKVLTEADKLLVEAAIEPQPVAPKVLVPLLESASLEDDEFLQKTWAALLANAANPHCSVKVEPSFVDIMRQVTTNQVRILNALFPESRRGTNPNKAPFTMETSYIKEVVMADGVSDGEFDVAFDNLVRLRLCTASGMVSMHKAISDGPNMNLAMATGEGTANIGSTKLGIAFLEACSTPNGPKPPTS